MSGMVSIIDVTNRDGAQASRILIPKLAKTLLNIYLDRMGVFQSEIGFPTIRHEIGYINANLKLAANGAIRTLRLQGWCRAVSDDVEAALSLCPGLRHLNLSFPASDVMIGAKFQGRKDFAELFASFLQSAEIARHQGVESISLGAEDASRAPLERLCDLAAAAKAAGIDRIRYSDTLGLDDPVMLHKRIGALSSATGLPIEVHCHNDLGLAVASSIAAARSATEAGVDAYINTTVNGYGERAGNCDLVTTLLALTCSPGLKRIPLDSRLDLSQAWKIARYASYAFGIPIPIMQPGVGMNAFAHESGIHADGVLKNSRCYEPFEPSLVGRGEPLCTKTGRIISMGAYSGLSGFRHVYERLGVSFPDDATARRVLQLVQLANLQTLKPLTDDELVLIAEHPEIVAEILTVTV